MIEKIEEVRTKLKAVLVFEGESLRHEEVPLLLEGPTDLRDVAAKVAKDSTHMGAGPGPANGKRLFSGPTKGVKSRETCSARIAGCFSRHSGVKCLGPGKFLREAGF